MRITQEKNKLKKLDMNKFFNYNYFVRHTLYGMVYCTIYDTLYGTRRVVFKFKTGNYILKVIENLQKSNYY